MVHKRYDVVVIGAGLGGLSAAAYLAKDGKSVLVLEHHTVPGGYAHEFRRGHYRFEVALHALDGAGPGGWAYPVLSDLELLDQVKLQRLDPFYTVKFPEHEVTAFADPFAYEAELIRHFPDEAHNIREMIDRMIKIYYEVRRFITDGQLNRRAPIQEIPGEFPNMLATMSQSWDDFMSRFIQDPKLKSVFSTLWGYYGLPPATLNAATFIFPWVSYHLFGAHYPEKGSMAISRALENTIVKYGGEIQYRQTVNRIVVKDGLAVGVETDKGLRVDADIIVSNANAPDTILRFIEPQHFPDTYIKKAEAALAKPALSNLVVYMGLERSLTDEGWPYHELFVSPSYDQENEYEKVLAGNFEDPSLVITHYSHVDPSCAPDGASIVSLFSLAPWNYEDQWGTGDNPTDYSKNPRYQEIKQAAADALISAAEKHLPGLREAAKFIEVGTPLTNMRYSLNPGGSIYGSEQSVDNMHIGRLQEKTPICNLFLAGAWAFGGGMSAAMLSGRNAAWLADAYLKGEDTAPLTGISLQDIHDEQNEDAQTLVSDYEVPAIELTATVSGRKVSLNKLSSPAVLLFHTQETAAVAGEIDETLRQVYPRSSDLFIAHVVFLKSVPKMFRSIARGALKKAYQEATEFLEKGLAPEDYVVILPDWEGQVTEAFGLDGLGKTVAVAILDEKGETIGVYQEDNLAQITKEALEKLVAVEAVSVVPTI